MEHVSRAATDSHVPGSENLERQNRGVEQVSQLVREELQSVGAARRCDIHGGLIPLTSIFGDRPGNRIVEAPVQHAEIRDANRGVRLGRQLGDRLADITVVVHDLRHGEPLIEKLTPVSDRALPDLGVRDQAEAQWLDQLIEEERHPMVLAFIANWNPRSDLRLAARNDLLTVGGNEMVKHGEDLIRTSRAGRLGTTTIDQFGGPTSRARDVLVEEIVDRAPARQLFQTAHGEDVYMRTDTHPQECHDLIQISKSPAAKHPCGQSSSSSSRRPRSCSAPDCEYRAA